MSENDKTFLRMNWERMKVWLGSDNSTSIDISSSCFAQFGTCGMTLFKWKNNAWHRKIVNYWRDLSFDEYLEQFNNQEWELA